MGVLNVTADSFADGGRYLDLGAAIERAERMVADGAAIVDVGGESTRPGAAPVPLDEELRRVLPVVRHLAEVPVVVSVDTSKPEVMRAAIDAGAGLVNDVRALQAPGALEAVARGGAGICLMHMQGEPATMQQAPAYGDVVTEVKAFLEARVQACTAAGIGAERICVDPGFGFGKTLEHNLQLLRALPQLGVAGRPVLVGLSRKSMLGALIRRPVEERLAGSLALALWALQGGARIIRTHDVGPTRDALSVWTAVSGG
ncbi:MAG: dihydropteroate synthase [Sinobacteraceae bacterium]|nr:dihydropteroate synthase [Nevskiaceae bacterium]MCP5360810.1 dihydropteroate synthase [Nevskiaceae bacterium]MCP5467048.1 dihydropteroate synthase [Nevskiaceae bacterium]MCP5473055.1 dihydropteroate synthase [Nevskiaceae bacterium]